MRKLILILFLLVSAVSVSFNHVRAEDVSGTNAQEFISLKGIKDGAVLTTLSFSRDDIDEVFVEKGHFGGDLAEYKVAIILNKPLWGKLETFTKENMWNDFELRFNGQVTNKGGITDVIDSGRLLIKRRFNTRKEAETFAGQIKEAVGYRDVMKKEKQMYEESLKYLPGYEKD